MLAGCAAGAAVAFCFAYKFAVRTMMSGAIDRKEPKLMSKTKVSGSAAKPKDAEVLKLAAEKRAALESTEHETVEIESYDGLKLVGHLFRAEPQTRVVVAMHGWRSVWSNDFCTIMDFWRENGCTVLIPEQRGQGGSDGEYMGFGLTERYDCLSWVRWLNENGMSDLPVYLVGISMGATTVLMTSGLPDIPQNVKGIIADCGFTSPEEIWRHVAHNTFKVPYGMVEKEVNAICRKCLGADADSYSTLDAMEVNTIPVLFIHGSSDTFVPMKMTLQNYNACKAPKKLLIVGGAEHGMSYMVDREKYEGIVLEFFSEND